MFATPFTFCFVPLLVPQTSDCYVASVHGVLTVLSIVGCGNRNRVLMSLYCGQCRRKC